MNISNTNLSDAITRAKVITLGNLLGDYLFILKVEGGGGRSQDKTLDE